MPDLEKNQINGREPLHPAGDAGPAAGGLTRRRFLALAGASAALAAGGCSADRGAVVPATRDPEGFRPGVAERYATTFQEGFDLHPVVVRTREGRPLHVEGNDLHPAARGKTSLRALADLLSLYDPDRLAGPLVDGRPAPREAAERRCLEALAAAARGGGRVLLVTGAVRSPSRAALHAELARRLPGLVHVEFEPAESAAAAAAREACLGGMPPGRPRLENARVVVAFEPDLLGGHRPLETSAFAARRPRGLEGERTTRLYALEGAFSVTGAAADLRLPLPPSRAAFVAFALSRALAEAGAPLPAGLPAAALAPFTLEAASAGSGIPGPALRALAADLVAARGSALAVAGPSLPVEAQVAALLLDAMAGGGNPDLHAPTPPPPAAAHPSLAAALAEAAGGGFAAALFDRVNPAYAFPDRKLWEAAVARIPFRCSLALAEDETAAGAHVVLAAHHWLESWGDFTESPDRLCLAQPCVAPLYDTLQAEESLLRLARALGADLPETWRAFVEGNFMRAFAAAVDPAAAWRAALHDGFARLTAPPFAPPPFAGAAAAAAAAAAATSANGGLELLLLPSPALHDGRYGNVGWLQELPDPVAKMTWGNALAVSPADAAALALADGDVVALEAGGARVELPALVQPGQAPGVVSTHLGYGRAAGSVAAGVGANVWPLVALDAVSPFLRLGARVTKLGRRDPLPLTQEHHRLDGRDLARRLTVAAFRKMQGGKGHAGHTASLYPPLRYPEHKWGMVVDLAACVGCGACVVACQAENNIPCVGPEGVLASREMHWMRIDRYYEGGEANPRAHFLPVLCQQCDTAPCETVCPVYATNHSDDGLNQMAYNRCVGTRYCGNNCPYRVRRFNFLEYAAGKSEPERLAMNPEVTVRPRGVMEKCTFCIQRIQEARMRAKVEGRKVADGEVAPACVAACPGRALVFGNLLDPAAEVTRLAADPRGYKLLGELGTLPAVTYLARLDDPPEAGV